MVLKKNKNKISGFHHHLPLLGPGWHPRRPSTSHCWLPMARHHDNMWILHHHADSPHNQSHGKKAGYPSGKFQKDVKSLHFNVSNNFPFFQGTGTSHFGDAHVHRQWRRCDRPICRRCSCKRTQLSTSGCVGPGLNVHFHWTRLFCRRGLHSPWHFKISWGWYPSWWPKSLSLFECITCKST